MASDPLRFILAELPHLDSDAIRDLYHEAVSHSVAFHTFLQSRLATAPGETADNWLERRLAGLAREELCLLLVAVSDGGFNDALHFMAHQLGLAADRSRMPPPPPPPLLFGLPVRTAAAAGLPIRTAANKAAAAPRPVTGFGDSGQPGFDQSPGMRQDPFMGYNDPVYPSSYRVALPPGAAAGPWVQIPRLGHDGLPGLGPTAPGVPGFEGPAPPPPSPLDVLADAAAATSALESPAPTLNTTPLRHPATTGTARFNPLERPAGTRRPRSKPTTSAAPRPTAAATRSPSPDVLGSPGADWRPRSPGPRRQRPGNARIAEQDLRGSAQRCVRCGTTYLEAQNTGRRACRYHPAYPVADAGRTAAWGAAAAAGVAAEPHFRPSLFARADLAGAFLWPCCGRRGGGPAPDPGCRSGVHVSETTRPWRAPNFHGWERYGRQGREEGGEGN